MTSGDVTRRTVLPERRLGAPFQGPFPIVGIHATLLHTGKVLLVDKVAAYLWDPVGSQHQRIDPPFLTDDWTRRS